MMGLLGDIFDDAIDIVSSPLKVGAHIADSVLDTDIEEYVDELKDAAKGE